MRKSSHFGRTFDAQRQTCASSQSLVPGVVTFGSGRFTQKLTAIQRFTHKLKVIKLVFGCFRCLRLLFLVFDLSQSFLLLLNAEIVVLNIIPTTDILFIGVCRQAKALCAAGRRSCRRGLHGRGRLRFHHQLLGRLVLGHHVAEEIDFRPGCSAGRAGATGGLAGWRPPRAYPHHLHYFWLVRRRCRCRGGRIFGLAAFAQCAPVRAQ
mmetsp:Transcript_16820/g.42955  ORF Transcript_16820/g.42955 Transcript_16820/m.42955 type:complete len:208 (+) Transcript_16820:95-718(+)